MQTTSSSQNQQDIQEDQVCKFSIMLSLVNSITHVTCLLSNSVCDVTIISCLGG